MIDRSALETFVEAIAVFGLGLADIEGHEASGEVALEATCDGRHLKGLTREQRCAAVRPWPGDTTVEVWLGDALREHVFDEVGAPADRRDRRRRELHDSRQADQGGCCHRCAARRGPGGVVPHSCCPHPRPHRLVGRDACASVGRRRSADDGCRIGSGLRPSGSHVPRPRRSIARRTAVRIPSTLGGHRTMPARSDSPPSRSRHLSRP